MTALAKHLSVNSDRMIWEDMQLGPSGSPRPDVYTILKSYSRPLPTAYECKVSVSDFRSDVTSGKWQNYLRFAGAVIFCTPAGLVQKEDVPKGCGLIYFYEDTGSFRTVRNATYNAVTIPQDALLKLLIDGVKRAVQPIREANRRDFCVMRQVRAKVGNDVADFLRSRDQALAQLGGLKLRIAAAEERLKDLQKIEDEACVRGSDRALRLEAEAKAMLSDIRSTVGLPSDADIWAIRNAVHQVRTELHADKEVVRLSSVIEDIRRVINAIRVASRWHGIQGGGRGMNKLRKPDSDFTQIPNALLRDDKVSLKAKGVYCLLYSKPDDWVYIEEVLVRESWDGRDAFRSAVAELARQGWLSKRQVRKDGVFSHTEIWLHAVAGKPVDGESVAGSAVDGKSDATNTDQTKTDELIPPTPKGEPDGFAEIWKCVWRRGEGKAQPRKPALKAYIAALKRGDKHEDILAAIKARAGVDKPDTEFAPHLSTWLNEERWKDIAAGTSRSAEEIAAATRRHEEAAQRSKAHLDNLARQRSNQLLGLSDDAA